MRTDFHVRHGVHAVDALTQLIHVDGRVHRFGQQLIVHGIDVERLDVTGTNATFGFVSFDE
ncbi:hypothetical protein D3C78_1590040 [compost metagenome]